MIGSVDQCNDESVVSSNIVLNCKWNSYSFLRCFAVEDTSAGCYRDLVDILIAKGWKRMSSKKRSKLVKKR